MPDLIILSDRNRTLRDKLNAAITALNTAISDISTLNTDLTTDYLNKTTGTAQSVAANITFNSSVTCDDLTITDDFGVDLILLEHNSHGNKIMFHHFFTQYP